ncbi:MAG: glycosyltransferase [Planctomycetota bacterium]|jgi:ceramide glucosyltransferase
MTVFSAIALAAGALALLRYAVALPILSRWMRRGRVRAMPAGATPPISLLKPLYGSEPGLDENLEATLRQNYPEFEVIFVHEREDDPAIASVEAAAAAVPDVPVSRLAGRDDDAANPKVAVLIPGERAARFGIIAASDSDVRPDPLFLRDIANALDGSEPADAVSFAPVLFGAESLPSRLAGLAVNTDFFLAVLLAGRWVMTGSAVAVRREALEKIGGWSAVQDRIADDYALGQALRKNGYKLTLAHRATRIRCAPTGWGATGAWMMRWARTVRAAAVLPYLGALVLAAAPLLLVVSILIQYSPLAVWLLVGITLARVGTAVAIELRYVWDGSTIRTLPYLPLLWVLEPAFLLCGLLGRIVVWRGRRYRLRGDRATLASE